MEKQLWFLSKEGRVEALSDLVAERTRVNIILQVLYRRLWRTSENEEEISKTEYDLQTHPACRVEFGLFGLFCRDVWRELKLGGNYQFVT